MHIEKIEINNKIHLLVFDTQKEAGIAFLRFEESYESPKFKGKIFTLDKFKKWYMKNSPKNKGRKGFTYYSDWTAFNIPSSVLKPFYAGKFDPLSLPEKKILEMFRNTPGPFYVIAVHKQTKQLRSVLHHEISHALFSLDKNYSSEVVEHLSLFSIEPFKQELRSNRGYHDDILHDEIQALLVDGEKNFKAPVPKELATSLKKLYKKYSKINGVRIPSIHQDI